MSKQLLLGHRGYSAIAPENTKLSFELAHLFGFDGVELDVHLTKDNQLVIIHDENTLRTGLVSKLIKDHTLAELKEENLAAFFKIKVPRQEILTLEEFLDLFLDKFKVINVEIKTDVLDYPGIEEEVGKVLTKYENPEEKLVFSSFNFNTLVNLNKLNPKYQLGFLWWTKTQFNSVDKSVLTKICKYLNPWTEIYKKDKEYYKTFKKPFCLWTLKSKDVYEYYLNDEDVYIQISNYKY